MNDPAGSFALSQAAIPLSLQVRRGDFNDSNVEQVVRAAYR
jgi:hypothetical protein